MNKTFLIVLVITLSLFSHQTWATRIYFTSVSTGIASTSVNCTEPGLGTLNAVGNGSLVLSLTSAQVTAIQSVIDSGTPVNVFAKVTENPSCSVGAGSNTLSKTYLETAAYRTATQSQTAGCLDGITTGAGTFNQVFTLPKAYPVQTEYSIVNVNTSSVKCLSAVGSAAAGPFISSLAYIQY